MEYEFFSERNKRLAKVGFSDEYDFIYPERTKTIYDIYSSVLSEWDSRIRKKHPIRSLYLFGNMGTGKSSLLALLADALITHGKKVEYITAHNYITASKARDAEYLAYLSDIDYLMLDDLGWAAIYESDVSYIIELIRDRYNQNKPCFVCSNLNLKKLIASKAYKGFASHYKQLKSFFEDELKYKQVIFSGVVLRAENKEFPERPIIENSILNQLPKIQGL
jgi:predicted ATPase